MVLSETRNPRVVHSEGCEVYSVQCMEVHVRKTLNGIKRCAEVRMKKPCFYKDS